MYNVSAQTQYRKHYAYKSNRSQSVEQHHFAKGVLGRAGTAALAGDIALADMTAADIAANTLLKIN